MITTDTHVYFYSGKEIYSNWHRCQFIDPITGFASLLHRAGVYVV